MHRVLLLLAAFLFLLPLGAKEVKDTIYTRENDKMILGYSINIDGSRITIQPSSAPRIIPSESLRRACKGDLSKLKIVAFDRVGNYGKVKWNGMTPRAFTVPFGLSYDKSVSNGYYIFGESAPFVFTKTDGKSPEIKIPLYIALYEKKQTYRIIAVGTHPLTVSTVQNLSARKVSRQSVGVERIAVHSDEERDGDNENTILALSSIQMIRQLLSTETEFPISQALNMEIINLRSLKDRITDPDVIDKINEVFMEFNEKERELKEKQKQASISAQLEEQALLKQQKQEEAARQKKTEEEIRLQQERQQKRTLWMVIGGIILAVLGFIGNGIFKHFRDVSNQKNILRMQESLSRQAEHEASRRTREIMRNQAHQMANQGKNKIRESLKETTKPKTKTNRKSI